MYTYIRDHRRRSTNHKRIASMSRIIHIYVQEILHQAKNKSIISLFIDDDRTKVTYAATYT